MRTERLLRHSRCLPYAGQIFAAMLSCGLLLVACRDERKEASGKPQLNIDMQTALEINRKYDIALSNALISIPVAAEFAGIFTNVGAAFGYFTGELGTPRLDLEADLYSRYVLTLQVEVDFDKAREKVLKTGPPAFYLKEVERVIEHADGAVESFAGSTQHKFGEKEWAVLIKNQLDFRAIGLTLLTNKPVPGFENVLRER